MLLEQVMVDNLASLDIVHPFPCALIESVLSIFLCVVIFIFSIGFTELLVLFLNCLKVALEVLGEVKIFTLVKWLRVQSWEEKETRSRPVVCRRA